MLILHFLWFSILVDVQINGSRLQLLIPWDPNLWLFIRVSQVLFSGIGGKLSARCVRGWRKRSACQCWGSFLPIKKKRHLRTNGQFHVINSQSLFVSTRRFFFARNQQQSKSQKSDDYNKLDIITADGWGKESTGFLISTPHRHH